MRLAIIAKRTSTPQDSSSVALPIDPGHTAVVFSWTHRGFSHPIARLERVNGTLFWNRLDLSRSSVEVVLQLEGLRTGDDALNKRLRGTDFFSSVEFPTITFKSTAVVPTPGTNEVTVVGSLTVHGISKPITLFAVINRIVQDPGEQAWVGFDADAILRRSDFGLSRYVPLVGDEIAVHITVEAHAE